MDDSRYESATMSASTADCESAAEPTSVTTSAAQSSPIQSPKTIPTPTRHEVLHFLIPSAIGMFIFLCPVWYQNQMNIPLGIISEFLADLIAPIASTLVCGVITASALISVVVKIAHPKLKADGFMSKMFDITPFYLVVRIVGAAVALMCLLHIGPDAIIAEDTGQTMFDLLGTLIAWFFAASFLIPLLMQYGIMEFIGTLLKNFTRPLFKIPGRATVDLLASWVGNCNVGVVLTTQQYEWGFYTAREAIEIATCFSAASLPFCLVISAMLGVDSQFFLFYLILCITGILSVIIMCRIPLLSKFPNTYYEKTGKQIKESTSPQGHRFKWALHLACDTASKAPSAQDVIKQGFEVFGNIIFMLTPTVMCYGTIALILANYTPIFNWLSMPFAYYLQLLGVPEAFEAAPGTIVGFVDMLIPAVVCAGITSFKTRFIIGILSLVQIVYMTEVGTIMITSKLPLKFHHLLLLFLEKTIIVLPIIVLLTNLFGIS